jgi:hypothetical protein
VRSRELSAIALKRTTAGDWIEHQLATKYLEESGGDLALWTGSVERFGLNPEDRWIADAPLCFRRSDFDRWSLKSSAPLPSLTRSAAAKSGETFWTAIQAIEWIATRDLLAVGNPKSELRPNALYPDALYDDLHEDASLAFQEVLEGETYKAPLAWRLDAGEELTNACRAGDVSAIGLEQGSGESVEISVIAWAHRKIADTRHGVACVPTNPFSDMVEPASIPA